MNENFAIQLFEGKKIRIVWDAEQEKYYFAVADIVQVLTDSADVKQYIKRMRARDPELSSKWGTICTPVEMLARLMMRCHLTKVKKIGQNYNENEKR